MARNPTEIAIQELKASVADYATEKPEAGNSLYLLRWLKACKMDVKKAEKMFRESMQWRKENNIEQLLDQEYHPDLKVQLPIYKGRLRSGAPSIEDGSGHNYQQIATFVNCITMIHLGRTNMKTLLETYGKDMVYAYVIQITAQEELNNIRWNESSYRNRGHNEEITPETIVGNAFFVDFKDASPAQLVSFKCFSLGMQICLDYVRYFPSLGSTCVCINCPKFGVPFVNVLKKIVEGPDLKIEIHGTNMDKWRDLVFKHADPEELPGNFGGNKYFQPFC